MEEEPLRDLETLFRQVEDPRVWNEPNGIDDEIASFWPSVASSVERKDREKSCAASASREFSFKTGKVGSNATFRGTALLSGETQRGQEHAVEKQKITEDMYVMDLQALCAWLDWSIVESKFLTMKPTSITPCLK